jgi:cell division cycle 14/atypical dual specificity phosphatase
VDHFWAIPGRLGGGSHPARHGDLAERLDALSGLGYGAVLTLTEDGLDPQVLKSAGLDWLHLPIPESGAPSQDQMARAVRFLEQSNRAGKAVFAHCFAGYGRTGVVVAGLMIAGGEDPRSAIARVRRLRPGAVESARQEKFLLGMAAPEPR